MKDQKIVTIILDCGHARTWDILVPKNRYGSADTALCRHCAKPERVTTIMDKADMLYVSLGKHE